MSAYTHKQILGHPAGLFVLFFTELWERFSYYGMRAILVLYIISRSDAENAGLGWTEGEALALYGWYTMLVYVASIPGGLIADKLLKHVWPLIEEGKIKPVIDRTFSLEDATKGHTLMDSSEHIGKIVLTI